jgi:hypothetical protein
MATHRLSSQGNESKPVSEDRDPDFLVCDFDPHPRVDPGEYELCCTEAKVYKDPGLGVWKCRLRFKNFMLEDFPEIFGFINLGKDPKPPGRRSRYAREWAIANDGPPAKRRRMSPRIFKNKMFVVDVGWVQPTQHNGQTHTKHSRYSLVKEIKALACGSLQVAKHSST